MLSRKEKAKLYMDAADVIADGGEYSCVAIGHNLNYNDGVRVNLNNIRSDYAHMFCFDLNMIADFVNHVEYSDFRRDREGHVVDDAGLENRHLSGDETREHRLMMLTLAAAMAETGDL